MDRRGPPPLPRPAPARLAAVLPPALAALATLAALGLGAAACAEPPPFPEARIERARAAVRRARAEAAVKAPQELAAALAASSALERRLARERAARPWARRPQEVERLALIAERAALRAVARAREEGARLARESAAQRADLEERLAALAGETERNPSDRTLRAAWGRARIALEGARDAEARGDVDTAGRLLGEARTTLGEAEAHLETRYARFYDPRLRRLWQAWAEETLAATREGGPAVLVDKLARRCYLLAAGRIAAAYPAELGRGGLADKLYAGDAATPEGRYRVTEKRAGTATRYHRALVLDYPSDEDRRQFAERARRGLVPRGRSIGGAIEIHGHGGRQTNWTSGCVALRDAHIDRLFAAVEVGTPVTIVGTARLPLAPQARSENLPQARPESSPKGRPETP
jgi:L,D-transpeptidase-like protein